jgi:hypothetical protein
MFNNDDQNYTHAFISNHIVLFSFSFIFIFLTNILSMEMPLEKYSGFNFHTWKVKIQFFRDLTSLTPHIGRIIYFPCNKGHH